MVPTPLLVLVQVTKQSLAHRVVDEYQIERHFSQNDLRELYNFTPDRLDDPDRKPPPIPLLPKDRLLADMMKVRWGGAGRMGRRRLSVTLLIILSIFHVAEKIREWNEERHGGGDSKEKLSSAINAPFILKTSQYALNSLLTNINSNSRVGKIGSIITTSTTRCWRTNPRRT